MQLTANEHQLLVDWNRSGHTVKLGVAKAKISFANIGGNRSFFLIRQLYKSKQGVELRILTPSGELLVTLGTNPKTIVTFLFGELFPMLRRPYEEQIYIEPVEEVKQVKIAPTKIEVPIYYPTDRRKYPA